MPKTAAEFLNDLEKRGLVPTSVIATLKSQVAKSSAAVPPATVAKLLIDKGHLTAAQAQQLLGATPAAAKQPAAPVAADLAPLDDLQPIDDLQPLDDGLSPLDAVVPLDNLDPLDGLSDLGPVPVAAADPLAAEARTAAPQPAKGKKSVAASAKTVSATTAPASAQPSKRKSSFGWVLMILLFLALVGGGAAGAFLLIPRGGGDEELAAAEQDYQAKQYDAAAAKYDAFLAEYPTSEQAPLARVRQAAAKVLAACAASPQNWQPVLAAANEALPPVGGEPDLSQVHPELAPVLMDMAVELAGEAAEGAATFVEITAARDALSLAGDGRFVPGSLRQWQRLELAAEEVERAEYQSRRSEIFNGGVTAIKQASEAGDIAAAAAERAKLLAIYPDLANESSLRDLGPALAAAAVGKVQTAEYSTPAEAGERPTGIVGTLVLSTLVKKAAASKAGPPAFFSAAGSVWAADSATGKLLWRIHTGGGQQPVRLAADVSSDVLMVHSHPDELLCVTAASGDVKWRHKLAAPVAGAPLVSGGQILATTRGGQMVALDAQSGAGKRAAQLPQGARTGAAADASGQHVLQLGDHSLLYVLSAADLQCTRAVYIGHEPATIAVPPVVLPKHLVVVENRGSASSLLHVVSLDAGGLPQTVVQQIELPGQVFAPPVVLAGRLLIVTDQGRVLAYESAANPTSGLKEYAQAEAGTGTGVTRYPLVEADKLLVAGQGLRQFGPPAGGALKVEWAALGDEVLLGPPQIAGETVVCIRRQPESPGIVAAGLGRADGKVRWETRLAEPVSRVARSSDGASITVTSAAGGQATVAAADLVGHKTAPFQPAAAAVQLELASIAWRGGKAIATAAGSIAFVDAQTGSPKAEPLQLRLRPGERLEHCRLAAAGPKGEQLVVADGRLALYLIDLADEGGGQLAELASTKLEAPPILGLAVGENVVGLVDRRGQFVTFKLPDLQPTAAVDLKTNAIASGPTRVGDLTILATDRDELVALDRSLAQAWKVPLPHGPLAGECAVDAAGLIVACKTGWLCRLVKESGQEIAALDVGQPLAGSPLVQGQEAVIAAADGTLLKITLPQEQGAAP